MREYLLIFFFCYNIRFVSKIHILPWANDLLISAGGDNFIALWDYVPGKLLQTLNIKEIIETKVKC